MSRFFVLTLATVSVVATGCQQAKMGTAPMKSAPYLAPVNPQPINPGMRPPVPLPVPVPAPIPQPQPQIPIPVQPQPLPPIPRDSFPEPRDPGVVPVNPQIPTTPVNPVVPTTPGVGVSVNPPTQPVAPVNPVTPPPTVNVNPPSTPNPVNPPVRVGVPPVSSGFNTYQDVPTRPMPTRIAEQPRGGALLGAKPVPGPTQVIQTPPPPRSEVCVGPEGQECKLPQAKPGQCEESPLQSTRKGELDVLFVVDTSLSLRGGLSKEGGELAQLAREMENFVNELPLNTDIRIGVMLAHGPASRWHGRLFNAGKGDQTVISLAPAKTKEERSQQAVKAGQILTNKMIKVENDRSDAQGEAMLLSLYRGVIDTKKRAETVKAGLFRKDAALNVMIVSDEQDVCFDYEAANKATPGLNLEPRKKTSKKAIKDRKGKLIRYEEESVVDPHETRFFNSVCKTAVNGGALTPGHVYDALKSLKQDRPLILSALAYKTNNVPVGLEDENEQGHGTIDLVEHIGAGQVVDLGSVYRNGKDVSFAKELKFLGQFAHFKITFTNEWDCTSRIHPAAINKTSTKLSVIGRNGEVLASFNGACENARSCENGGGVQTLIVPGGPGGHYNKFRVNHQQLSKALAGKDTEGAKVRIDFMTRTDVDSRTGNPIR